MVMSFGEWPYGKIRVIVMSTKQVRIAEHMKETVESRSCSPSELVEELMKSGSKHLYVDGGKTIQGFINDSLITELTITRVPVLIGKDLPLFGQLESDKKLRHQETRLSDNGFVQSKYELVE